MNYDVLKYDDDSESWVLEKRKGVLGELDMCIMDIRISLKDYQKLISDCMDWCLSCKKRVICFETYHALVFYAC